MSFDQSGQRTPRINATAYDTGNELLEETTASLYTAILNIAGMQRLALTIRTSSTTVTVLLKGDDARQWSEQFAAAVKQMSASGLLVAGGG